MSRLSRVLRVSRLLSMKCIMGINDSEDIKGIKCIIGTTYIKHIIILLEACLGLVWRIMGAFLAHFPYPLPGCGRAGAEDSLH